MTREQVQEHQNRVNFGNRAKEFLAGKDWLDIVKPIIDSMVKGLDSVRDISKNQLTSNKKAEIEVLGRVHGIEYLEKIELLIGAYITDGDVSRKLLEKQQRTDTEALYREET